MLLLRGILVSSLLPLWAAVGLVVIGFASQAEVPLTDSQLDTVGLGADNDETLGTVAAVVLVVGLGLHLLAAVVTSRAVAAMAGSVGGIIAVVLAVVAALALAVAPDGERVDVLALLVRPAGIATVAIISLILGFRAFLAHTGRWAYMKHDAFDHNDWGDGD